MRAITDRIRGREQWLKQRQNHCETRLIEDQHLSPGGDRVGDRLKWFKSGWLQAEVLERKFEPRYKEAPFF
jgi:hypothetical protein